MSPLQHLRSMLWRLLVIFVGVLVGVCLVVPFLPGAHR